MARYARSLVCLTPSSQASLLHLGCILGEAGGSFFGDFLEALSRVSEGDAAAL